MEGGKEEEFYLMSVKISIKECCAFVYPLKFLEIRTRCQSMITSILVNASPFDYSVDLINMYADLLGTYFVLVHLTMLLEISAVNMPSIRNRRNFSRATSAPQHQSF